mmetsp:Transcript_23799/g.29255  ORF Transcript_23799/g.29255 Transcript_23799/m.29255 type:complete len:493 (+) Transcript_23799:89-1567(+)
MISLSSVHNERVEETSTDTDDGIIFINNNNTMSLYLGSTICLLALVLTRQTYKLSAGFRNKLVTKTKYHETSLDSPPSLKASVMLSVFQNAWPATVSEMLQDTETAHGMVFRSLMIAGCLIIMQTDFSGLTPSPHSNDNKSDAPMIVAMMGIVHLLRKHAIALAIGFCFAPAKGIDHDVSELRQQTTAASDESGKSSDELRGIPWLRNTTVHNFSSDQREMVARTNVVGAVHTILATSMLTLMPLLELIALAWETWHFAPFHFTRLVRSLDPCSLVWCTLALMRFLHIVVLTISVCVFMVHFIAGFFFTSGHHTFKGFWSEFAATKLFAQLMVLASIQSWFSWPSVFDAMHPYVQAVALVFAGLHILWYTRFCIRTLFLCLRNVEYKESELCRFFDASRRKERAFQTFLDAQLAFIARVQREFGATHNSSSEEKATDMSSSLSVEGKTRSSRQNGRRSSQMDLVREQVSIIAKLGSFMEVEKENSPIKTHID